MPVNAWYKPSLLLTCFFVCLTRAADVFNTPQSSTPQLSTFYGTPTEVHSPDYYNNLITTKNKQTYQSMVDASKAKQNDPTLKALQDKMLNSQNSQSLLMNNNEQTPQAPAPAPKVTHPPEPNTIYQTPVANAPGNNTATNFSSGDNKNKGTGSNNTSSGSGSLDIQY